MDPTAPVSVDPTAPVSVNPTAPVSMDSTAPVSVIEKTLKDELLQLESSGCEATTPPVKQRFLIPRNKRKVMEDCWVDVGRSAAVIAEHKLRCTNQQQASVSREKLKQEELQSLDIKLQDHHTTGAETGEISQGKHRGQKRIRSSSVTSTERELAISFKKNKHQQVCFSQSPLLRRSIGATGQDEVLSHWKTRDNIYKCDLCYYTTKSTRCFRLHLSLSTCNTNNQSQECKSEVKNVQDTEAKNTSKNVVSAVSKNKSQNVWNTVSGSKGKNIQNTVSGCKSDSRKPKPGNQGSVTALVTKRRKKQKSGHRSNVTTSVSAQAWTSK